MSVAEVLKFLSSHNVKVIITTDHGTVRVDKPIKVVGNKNTNTNLRFKKGKNLNFNNIKKKIPFSLKNQKYFHVPLN